MALDSVSSSKDTFRRRPLKLIIADDHLIVRQGIEALLKSEPDIRCVAMARNGDEVLPLLEEYAPDMLLTDLSMPGMPTLDILRECRARLPQLHIIVLTMHTTPFSVSEVFKAGAHAFIAKDDASDTLLDVIWRLAQGEEGISTVERDSAAGGSAPNLTPRELEVMREIALGMSTKEIGDHLNLSLKTVELYRTRLLRKFRLTKATELVRVALESGVLSISGSSDPAGGGAQGGAGSASGGG